MPFNQITRDLLAYYTAHRPRTEDVWYGPWTTILTTLFPSDEGYVVTPQRKLYDEDGITSRLPDFVFEVTRIEGPDLDVRTVLIVEIKNSHHWPDIVDRLLQQLNHQIDYAFASSARNKLYWVAVVGPHWRYGVKEDDGQDDGPTRGLTPLIEWHHTTHEDASFSDFQALAALVRAI